MKHAISPSPNFGSMPVAITKAGPISALTIRMKFPCSNRKPSKAMPCAPCSCAAAWSPSASWTPQESPTEASRLWTNMVERRMYLTGGVGAESNDEKFGPDFFLPNTGYAETCAATAAAFRSRDESLLRRGALCG